MGTGHWVRRSRYTRRCETVNSGVAASDRSRKSGIGLAIAVVGAAYLLEREIAGSYADNWIAAAFGPSDKVRRGGQPHVTTIVGSVVAGPSSSNLV